MNFILRRITSENRQSNKVIGEYYDLVYDDRKVMPDGEFSNEHTPMSKHYAKMLSDYPKDNHKDIHAFIVKGGESDDTSQHGVIPLYCKSTYYVMTDSGQTFAKINRCHFD